MLSSWGRSRWQHELATYHTTVGKDTSFAIDLLLKKGPERNLLLKNRELEHIKEKPRLFLFRTYLRLLPNNSP